MKEEEEAPTPTITLTRALANINIDVEEHPSSRISLARALASRNSKVFPSLSSLPRDMVVKCLAHIPTTYYPKVSLVSKTFHSLISSTELSLARTHLKTRENVLYDYLQLRSRGRLPSWFSLWLKPDQILTKETNMSTGDNTMLVSIPSSQCAPRVPEKSFSTGFKSYSNVQDNRQPRSFPMCVRDERMLYPAWRCAPRMKVARANPIMCILHEKIHRIGGCEEHESRKVLDTKAQTWESKKKKNILTRAPSNIHIDEEERASFSSLPREMVVNCLAHIPKAYYPKLSLVSNTFRSLISSSELRCARTHLETLENVFYVYLQLPGRCLPSWFSLWLRPDEILTNDMEKETNMSKGNTMLVGVPSQYCPRVPASSMGSVGFESYLVFKDNTPPTFCPMYLRDDRMHYPRWRKAPRMKVARENPFAIDLHGKIYVMGGCKADESTNWAEVFDTETETWESLPDPGPELRFSFIKQICIREGNVYVRSSEKNDYFYDPREGRWGVVEGVPPERSCRIAGNLYTCTEHHCWWYNTKLKLWRVVRGLEVLDQNCWATALAIANYGEKLLVLWDKFEEPDQCKNKNIWCSVIALERRNGEDQVWGNVEWASVVLTVPSSYLFLRTTVLKV